MSESKTAMQNKLRLTGVCKNFGGVTAAKDICVDINAGEVLGLIGPNGAGKTTMINLITGVYSVSKGTIEFLGKDVTKLPVHKRAMMGIGRTFQHPHLLGRCDIMTNIIMGSDMSNRRGHHSVKEQNDELKTLLKCAGLENVNLYDSVDKLSYGQQKML